MLFLYFFSLLFDGVFSLTIPFSQRLWYSKLTHTYPNFADYPKSFLSSTEQEFVSWLLSHRSGDTALLRSNYEVARKAQSLWPALLGDKSLKSIAVNFYSGKSYLNREYRLGKRKLDYFSVEITSVLLSL